MNKLTDGTWIPLGLAVVVIGGASMWLTSMWEKTNANAASIQEMTVTQKKYLEDIHNIREDLREIKGELKRIERGD